MFLVRYTGFEWEGYLEENTVCDTSTEVVKTIQNAIDNFLLDNNGKLNPEDLGNLTEYLSVHEISEKTIELSFASKTVVSFTNASQFHYNR
jgi:hypothetical protein